MEADLLTIQADLENPVFIFDSQEFPAISVSSLTEALTLDDSGGFSQEQGLVIVVRITDFDGVTPPVSQKDKITYKSTVYRVERVIENANSAFIKLIVIDPNRMK